MTHRTSVKSLIILYIFTVCYCLSVAEDVDIMALPYPYHHLSASRHLQLLRHGYVNNRSNIIFSSHPLFYPFNPLTAGVAYIRVFIFISTLSTTF